MHFASSHICWEHSVELGGDRHPRTTHGPPGVESLGYKPIGYNAMQPQLLGSMRRLGIRILTVSQHVTVLTPARDDDAEYQ